MKDLEIDLENRPGALAITRYETISVVASTIHSSRTIQGRPWERAECRRYACLSGGMKTPFLGT